MKYRALINQLRRTEPGVASLHPADFEVRGITLDSREVEPGYIFAALPGTKTHGREFVDTAIQQGASAVLTDKKIFAGLPQVISRAPRRTLAQLAAHFYGCPSESMYGIGVTGTNGKTTCSVLIRHIFQQAARKCGLIGTIATEFGEQKIDAAMTTPEAPKLQQWLSQMRDADMRSFTMEVSSHALSQHRVTGVDFDAALFTNLTQDHLDYHRTMEAYAAAKARLFSGLKRDGIAIANTDDPWGWKMVSFAKCRVETYGINAGADFRICDLEADLKGTRFNLRHLKFHSLEIASPLVGRFNAYNLAGAAAIALNAGIDKATISAAIANFDGAPGRMDRVALKNGPSGPETFVDYAHTPDALENVLKTLSVAAGSRRIVTVFGCGGDRDRTKRPQMGKIAEAHSHIAIVTSDNPRSEQPDAIIEDILKGMRTSSAETSQSASPCQVIVEADRRSAIRRGVELAGNDGVLLVAGKGHETYQIIGRERLHFDDREEVQAALVALQRDQRTQRTS